MRPGMTVLPDALTTVAPCGTGTRARGPAAVMRSPLTRMTESLTTAAPVPSTSRAPTMAVTGPVAPRCACGTAASATTNAVHRLKVLRLMDGYSYDLGGTCQDFGLWTLGLQLSRVHSPKSRVVSSEPANPASATRRRICAHCARSSGPN